MTGDDLLVDDTTTEIDRLASAWPQEYRLGYRFGFLNKADQPCDSAGYPLGLHVWQLARRRTLGGAGRTKGASPSARPLQETTAMDKAPLLTSEEIAAAVAAEKAKHQRANGEQRGTSTNKRRDKSTKFKLVPFEGFVSRWATSGPSSAFSHAKGWRCCSARREPSRAFSRWTSHSMLRSVGIGQGGRQHKARLSISPPRMQAGPQAQDRL